MRISDWSSDVCSSDLEAVPAQRLRRLVLKTGLEASADRLVLHNTDLRLDVSRLTGGAAIARRERPGLGVALNIDKVNLDAYLPEPEPEPEPEPATEPAPAPAQSATGEGGGTDRKNTRLNSSP